MATRHLPCFLLALAACAAREKAVEPLRRGYQFKAGEVLRFKVASDLTVDMNGTHPALLVKGIAQPLSWNLEGEFENVVLDVDEKGEAKIERRVRAIESSGHYLREKFGLAWDGRKQPVPPVDAEGGAYQMDQFVSMMISVPLTGLVDARGVTRTEASYFGRLVVRQGMMYWPLGMDEVSWPSTEEIAVPILHDKIRLSFANSITERSGSIVRISAPAKREVNSASDVEYSVAGGATVEFDEESGRLMKLELDIRISFSGKAPIPGGGEGDIKGVATYKETQVLIE